MPFDEEELDPHGECAAEIAKLRGALTLTRQYIKGLTVANAVTPDGSLLQTIDAALGDGQLAKDAEK